MFLFCIEALQISSCSEKETTILKIFDNQLEKTHNRVKMKFYLSCEVIYEMFHILSGGFEIK